MPISISFLRVECHSELGHFEEKQEPVEPVTYITSGFKKM